ncbi:MAG: hypothetical protein Q4C00_07745 [Bacillota bacterium]|nr:hypothetical protein [Bacillota bacterium]
MKKTVLILFVAAMCLVAASCGEEKTAVVDGIAIAYLGDELEINTGGSTNYLFNIKDAAINNENSYQVGESVRVEYSGELEDNKISQDVKVVAVTFGYGDETILKDDVEPKNNSETEGDSDDSSVPTPQEDEDNDIKNGQKSDTPMPEAAENEIEGSITAVTVEVITVETSQGVFDFYIEDAGVSGDEFSIGDVVIIGYSGQLNTDSENSAISVKLK